MAKINLQDEIRRITNETAANAASKALEVAEQAKAKAAEVSTLAIAEALKAATLAATKAADAASAAAAIAASTSKDLEYIKKDIADTKQDVKDIKESLNNKYTNKDDFSALKNLSEKNEDRILVLEKNNYEGQGRGAVINPQIEALINQVKTMNDYQNTKQGSGTGMAQLFAWIVSGVSVMIAIILFVLRLSGK